MKSTEVQYAVNLLKLVKAVKADIDVELLPLIKQDYIADTAHTITVDAWFDIISAALQRLLTRWTNPYMRKQAEQIASSFVTTASNRNSRSVAINVFQNSTQLQDYLKAAAYQNAQLIKSIPQQYLEQVSNIVMGNMRQGMRPSYIEGELVKQFGITQRRAKLIARDQTSKITGEITRLRQTGAGIEYFRWQTSNDQRVRHDHTELQNRVTPYGKGVYRWDDLPKENGVPVYPGSPINCRCVAIPVTNAQVERNKAKG